MHITAYEPRHYAGITAYGRGTVSAAEAATVRAWLAQPAHQLLAQHWMLQHGEELAAELTAAFADSPDYEALLTSIQGQLTFGQRLPPRQAAPAWRRWAAAAAGAGALLGGGSWRLLTHAAPTSQTIATSYGHTPPPTPRGKMPSWCSTKPPARSWPTNSRTLTASTRWWPPPS